MLREEIKKEILKILINSGVRMNVSDVHRSLIGKGIKISNPTVSKYLVELEEKKKIKRNISNNLIEVELCER